jgi:hypothetical protein
MDHDERVVQVQCHDLKLDATIVLPDPDQPGVG